MKGCTRKATQSNYLTEIFFKIMKSEQLLKETRSHYDSIVMGKETD